MVTVNHTVTPSYRHRVATTVILDYAMLAATSVLIAGLYSDGWAHDHHLVDTFFTPWHGILYSGFFLSSITPIIATLLRWRTTGSLPGAIPRGYELAIFGGPLFLFGGAFDEMWHRIVGFEIDVETLLSPSHLLLLTIGLLLLSAPLRARLLRPEPVQGWGILLPAWVSLGYVIAVITFFTAYIQPFDRIFLMFPGSNYFPTAISAGSILFQSALYAGVLLFALRRFGLPLGSITLLLIIPQGLQSLIHLDLRLILVALLGGMLGDLAQWVIRPTYLSPVRVRLFAFLAPVILYSIYFAAFAVTTYVAWSLSLWLGTIVLAGGMGLLVSFAFTQPLAADQPQPITGST